MNLTQLRRQFPALMQQVAGQSPIFLDGPGGSQVPQSVLSAMTAYLGYYNSNLGGAFFSSDKTVELMANARQAAADLLNAPSKEQIVFGANMTSLTFSFSRAISRDWTADDDQHYGRTISGRSCNDDEAGSIRYVIPTLNDGAH